MLEDHLAQAKEHVRRGAEHVATQKRILADLARDGHDTKLAQTLLQSLEATQEMHIADLERIAAELADSPKP